MPAPTNTIESRDFEINRLSDGKGYAFLTTDQKKSVNAIADPVGNVPNTQSKTVYSDVNIRENVIPDLNKRLDKVAETGQYLDAQNNLRNADNTLAEDPRQKEVDQLTTEAQGIQDETDTMLADLQSKSDANTSQQIASIKSQYAIYKQQQADINMRTEAGTDTALLLGGSSRYAVSSGAQSGAQVSFGIRELAALEAEEESLIAEAKAAQASNNFKILELKLGQAEKMRAEKIKKATEISNTIAEENKALRESMSKASRESRIADLYSQGIDDPLTLLDFLNYDNNGKQVGDFSLKEIETVLGILNPPENYAGLTADFKTFKQFFPDTDITTAAGRQSYLDWQQAVKNANTASGSTGAASFTSSEIKKLEQAGLSGASRQEKLDYLYGDQGVQLTSEDQRNLVGAGFTQQDIGDIQKAVNDFGIEQVLKNIDNAQQRAAVEKAYGVAKQITEQDIKNTVTQKVAQEGLSATYTDEELVKLAKDNGFGRFFQGKEKEVEKFLNSATAIELYTELLKQQYRDAGMLTE